MSLVDLACMSEGLTEVCLFYFCVKMRCFLPVRPCRLTCDAWSGGCAVNAIRERDPGVLDRLRSGVVLAVFPEVVSPTGAQSCQMSRNLRCR